jgi:flagellar biosynthetic protein FlhB
MSSETSKPPVATLTPGHAFDLQPRYRLAFDPGAIHLQWFAAEDEGRTEEPSETKLRKAREEGRVAKSQELIGAVGLLFPAVALMLLGPYYAGTMRDMLVYYLSLIGKTDITRDSGPVVAAFFSYFAKMTLPIAAVAVVGAIFSNVLQVGFVFSAKPITPDFSKIVPRFGQYFKRALFSIEGLFNFAKSLVKILIIGVMAFLTIQRRVRQASQALRGPLLAGDHLHFLPDDAPRHRGGGGLLALACPTTSSSAGSTWNP